MALSGRTSNRPTICFENALVALARENGFADLVEWLAKDLLETRLWRDVIAAAQSKAEAE